MSLENSTCLSDKQIRTGLRFNILAACLGMVWFVIVQNLPLIMLLEALGASGVMIGMISMLNQAAMLVQIPASLAADRLKHRKPFWFITVFTARMIWLIPAIMLFFRHSNHHAAIVCTLSVVGISALLIQSSAASWWSWIADLIPDQHRSRFWNIRQGLATTVMLATLGVAGWFLDLFPKDNFTGFAVILAVGTVFGIADILVHLRVPEPPAEPSPKNISLIKRLVRPLHDSNFRYFTLIMCVWFFGLGLIGPFTMVYLKQNFHALYRHLSVIQMAGLIGSIITSFYAGRLIQRNGIRTFGIMMLLLVPFASIAWFFLDQAFVTLNLPWIHSFTIPRFVLLIGCNSLIGGSVYAAVGIYQLNMLTSIVPRNGRTIAMAMHWFLIGTSSAIAPLIAGRIKDLLQLHPIHLTLYHGTEFSFMHLLMILHAILIWLVALPLTRKLTAVETDMTVVKALSQIFITNPLRMAKDIYGFNGAILSSSISKMAGVVTQSAGKAIEIAEKAKGAVKSLINNEKNK